MSNYSIANARDDLSKLVDEAIAGEEVALTRDGEVVAYVRPAAAAAPRKPSAELLAYLFERARQRLPLGNSAVDLIREMRDERT